MTAASITAKGRVAAEALMVDTVSIQRQTGTTLNETTLAETPTYSSVYSGKGRVQRRAGMVSTDDVAGGFEFGVDTVLVQVPVSATGVQAGDVVTVTAVSAVTDDDLDGLVATVKANLTKTHATKRTLACEVVT